jgi:tight adherence protein B
LRENINDQSMRDKRRTDMARKLKDNSEGVGQKKGTKSVTIKDRLIYAGLDVPVANFWIGSAISAVVFFFLSVLSLDMVIAHILMAIFGFFGAPRMFLNFKTNKRQKKFLNDFADALESMVRLLKAGMPIGEAISMAAREYGGPVGEEMSRVYENQRIGVPMGEAVMSMAARMPMPEVQMFATGIVIQQQTGASLSDVLMNLAALIRARFRLRRKVQSLSAEAKASAMIIGALPVVVSTGLYFVNPDYIGKLFVDPFGKVLLSCAIGWMCVGIFIMKQMINFKV